MKINLPNPPSVNALYANRARGGGGKGRYKTRKYREWLRDADAYFSVQKKRINGFFAAGEYELSIRVNKGRKDLGNLEKAISDYLKRCGVISDDSNCVDIKISHDPSMAYCEVNIIERTT